MFLAQWRPQRKIRDQGFVFAIAHFDFPLLTESSSLAVYDRLLPALQLEQSR